MNADDSRLAQSVKRSIPEDNPDWVTWAESNVIFPKSVRSKHFRIAISPWIREPIDRALDRATRIVTLRKPVQTAGSVAGEIIIQYWIKFWRGMLQYNWANDKRAKERWESRIEEVFKSNKQIVEMIDRAMLYSNCEVNFGNVFFKMQGAHVPENLDSDSIALQVNEEVHAWDAGHLKKARNRSSAVWNYKSVDISNAGDKNDQLDQAFWDGTAQFLEVKCPGCGLYHEMRTRWEDDRPDLGGLRYDASGCRIAPHRYDYSKMRNTIRFQMPCGYVVHNEDIISRRALSESCRYSEPKNKGAELSKRSYTYQAVSCDFIDWMTLIQDKHDALRARANGDIEPWRRYITERECLPFDLEEIPSSGSVAINIHSRKSRDGMPEPRFRAFSLDRQQGNRKDGELPYWWLLIRDFKIFFGVVRSVLVYEGRHDADENAVKVIDDHGCMRWQGCADSGDDTDHVYQFCYRYGINAIKGGAEAWYVHSMPNHPEGGARRIYSPERPLCLMLNADPKYPFIPNPSRIGEKMPDPREPMFWLYSKGGIRERNYWMRNSVQYDTPSDVSKEYREHHEAEHRVVSIHPTDGSTVVRWVQQKRRNDQFVNECYVTMLFDMSGGIGEMAFANIETEKKS